MTEQAKKEQCCSTGCCSGKKVIVGALIGLLLFGSGYGLAMSGICAAKTCPVVQVQK